jgi:hypothetical protein
MSTESFARVKCERCPASYFRPEGVTLEDLDEDKKPLDVGAAIDLSYTESGTNTEISLVLADLCPTCRVEIQAALLFIKSRKEPGSWFTEPTAPVVVDVISESGKIQPVKMEQPPAAATPAATPKPSVAKPVTDSTAPKRTKRTMIEMAADAITERIENSEAESDDWYDWSASQDYLANLPSKKAAEFARVFKELRKSGDDYRPHFLDGDDDIWRAHRDALTNDGGDAPQDDEPTEEDEDVLDSNETIAPEEVEAIQPVLPVATPTDGFF